MSVANPKVAAWWATAVTVGMVDEAEEVDTITQVYR